MGDVKQRGERVTPNQKKIIVEFMEDHLEFARGKLLTIEGKLTSNNLWLVLCLQLDGSGPKKDVTKWQRVWTDMKINAKKKASGIACSRRKTRGGPPDNITELDDVDEKIIQIISANAVNELSDPDNIPFRSLPRSLKKKRLPETVPSCSHTMVEPVLKKQRVQWTDIAEVEEKDAVTEQLTDNFDPLKSQACSEMSSASRSSNSRRSWNKRSIPAEAADELKNLTNQSTEAIQDVGRELKSLNENVRMLVNQNQQMMEERKQTNSILLRIAKALEGQIIE